MRTKQIATTRIQKKIRANTLLHGCLNRNTLKLLGFFNCSLEFHTSSSELYGLVLFFSRSLSSHLEDRRMLSKHKFLPSSPILNSFGSDVINGSHGTTPSYSHARVTADYFARMSFLHPFFGPDHHCYKMNKTSLLENVIRSEIISDLWNV